MNILIVDDSSSIRQMLVFVLKSAGYQVAEAADGVEALEKIQRVNVVYDLIVTDVNMPRMGGLDLCKKIRLIPKHLKTPILILTTESSQDMKTQGRDAGASGWIVKPFDPSKFISVIKKLLP